ncbi:hypothetical protein U1Q18_012535 [Sarracenia purpurea var. burkii]
MISDEIMDLLPSDPFGMDLSATVTASKGCFEDIENDLELNSLGFVFDPVEVVRVDDGLSSGLNLVCNGSVKLHPRVDDPTVQEASDGLFDRYREEIENDLELNSLGFVFDPVEVVRLDDALSSGLNLVCNDSVKLHPRVDDPTVQEASDGLFDRYREEIENDLELNSLGFVFDPVEVVRLDDALSSGLNLVCNDSVKLHPRVDGPTIQESSDGPFHRYIEEIENDLELSSLGFVFDPIDLVRVDDGLSSGLNLVCNGSVKFHTGVDDSMIQETSVGVFDNYIEEIMNFIYDKDRVSSDSGNEFHDGDGGADPHDGLFFALGYLSVKDLISVEMVCKSLREAVRNDPLVWRSIHIEYPLNVLLTDDFLFRLTSRAQGTLQCLSLVECFRITDNGLKRVLERNSGLTKLSVPGCLRLSVDGILCNLKSLKSAGKLRIKHLRIGGIYGTTNKQFEELKSLLGVDNQTQLSDHRPRIYGRGKLYLSSDDDRAIDIEACPKCHKIRQVYDCPAESCQGKHQSSHLCRACTICVARCICCGCCIGDDFEETFCLDFLCLSCWEQLLNFENRQEEMNIHSSKCTIFHPQARYQFYFCG